MRRQTVTIWRSAALVVLLNIFFFFARGCAGCEGKKKTWGAVKMRTTVMLWCACRLNINFLFDLARVSSFFLGNTKISNQEPNGRVEFHFNISTWLFLWWIENDLFLGKRIGLSLCAQGHFLKKIIDYLVHRSIHRFLIGWGSLAGRLLDCQVQTSCSLRSCSHVVCSRTCPNRLVSAIYRLAGLTSL